MAGQALGGSPGLSMNHGKLGAARAEFITLDFDRRLVPIAAQYPTEYVQLHAATVVQLGWPIHRQLDRLTSPQGLLGGEPQLVAADFKRLTRANGEDSATLYALIPDVLLYREPAWRALSLLIGWNIIHC